MIIIFVNIATLQKKHSQIILWYDDKIKFLCYTIFICLIYIMKRCDKLTFDIIVNKKIKEKFDDFRQNGRILFFGAPCGFGKTSVAKELLKGTDGVFEISGEDFDFGLLNKNIWEVLLIDDLQFMDKREQQQGLCTLIRENPSKRFVLLSRGIPPGCLMPFKYSGLMYTVESNDMFFDKKTVAAYLKKYGAELSDEEITSIQKVTIGYPLAISVIANLLASGEKYDKQLLLKTKQELFIYFEESVYNRFDMPLRRFILDLAPFEEFETELAKMVSGESNAREYLDYIRRNTNMLMVNNIDKLCFWPIFRNFLLWKQKSEYTVRQQQSLFGRGGLYYELNGNYGKALEYYTQSGDMEKVSELLIKSTYLHPGMGHYEEMERYYLSLSDAQIALSPALMQGMSMLCALRTDYEKSEKWYHALKSFAEERKKSDAAAKEAKSRLVWLDISLPQRKISGLTDTIKAAFKLIAAGEIKLPTFSVTSTLPSIMNGGKDFSGWSKKDDFLYATMRKPVETVLGRDGVGLADCAVTESKFEKGEDVSAKMLTLVSKLSEVQTNGTPDIEFAIVGLIARGQLDLGRADEARRMVNSLKERFDKNGLTRFEQNIDALLCRIALKTGDSGYVKDWYMNKAPRDAVNFRVMKRYVYFTQAMAELTLGDETAALFTLAPLEDYCIACGRHIDTIHLKILTAAVKYRKSDLDWKNDMNTALDIAEEYGFVRTISEYGAAVLPMLNNCNWNKNKKFLNSVTEKTRGQTVWYPNFLKTECRAPEKLTEAEMQVLRLLCADKSNAEIGEILNIKLTTVKSHVSHILQKLGANRRSEAKTAARQLGLIEN